MSTASDEARIRLDGVVDRAGLPEWVDTVEMKAELFKVVDRLLKAEGNGEKWRGLIENIKRFELVRGQGGWGREIQLVIGEPATDGSYVRYTDLVQSVAKMQDEAAGVKPGCLSAQEKAELRIRAQNILTLGGWVGCKASSVLALLNELDSRP